MKQIKDKAWGLKIEGHLRIDEFLCTDDLAANLVHRCLLDKRNAIHPENMSIVIARGLADQPDGSIYSMWFGTGGATVDPAGNIIYATPNTTGAANLNNPVFFEVVDPAQGAPIGNGMSVQHVTGTLYSDVEVRCVMDANQPFGQPAFDNIGGLNLNSSTFVFSEIGLKSKDGLLLTHVVFAPVEKTANRIIQIIYDVRVQIVTS